MGLVVVQGAHQYWNTEHQRFFESPASARMLRDVVDPSATETIAIYNDVALGTNAYNHFEAFGRGGDFNYAVEWGLPVGDTSQMPTFNVLPAIILNEVL